MYDQLERIQRELEERGQGCLLHHPMIYAYGRCHVFMDVLNEVLGYKMELLWDDGFYDEDSDEMSVLVHAYCIKGNLDCVDIRGTVTKGFILDEYEYNEKRYEKITRERLENLYKWNVLERPSEEERNRIKEHIKENLHLYGKNVKRKNNKIVVEKDEGLGEATIVEVENGAWKAKFKGMKSEKEIIEVLDEIIKQEGVEKIGYVDNVYVKKEERKKGIGTQIVQSLLEEISSENVQMVVLESDEEYGNEFDITGWYQNSFSFQGIVRKTGNPILFRK